MTVNRLLVSILAAAVAVAANAQEAKRLKDIYPGSIGSSAAQITTINGRTVFQARDPLHGYELWTTDGTEKGTKLLKDINPGPGNGAYAPLVVAGRHAFFVGDDGRSGLELWCTDGTAGGTYLVADINKKNGGRDSSRPDSFVAGQTGVFFYANDGGVWTNIWWANSRGAVKTGATFYRTKPGLVNSGVFRDRLYYAFRKSVKDANNICLWTVWGTRDPLILKENVTANGFRVFKDRLWFGGQTARTGAELWVTDGTGGAGTKLVKDIKLGAAGSFPGGFTQVGDRMYFRADDGVAGYELWATDGTAAGTKLTVDVNPGPNSGTLGPLTACHDELYFIGDVGGGGGSEPIRSDGTPRGTWMLLDINPGRASSQAARFTAGGDGLVYFQARNVFGRELWVTNGAKNGTKGIDIAPGAGSSTPLFFAARGHGVLFQAWTPTHGRELWSADLLDLPIRMARVSAKRVVDKRGNSSWTLAKIRQFVTGASAIYSARLNLSLKLDSIVDLYDPGLPTSWQNSSAHAKREMERLAELTPALHKWRTDAINVYFVDRLNGAGGMCSFPACASDDNDLIVIPAFGSNPNALAHELGHYFGLSHTHAQVEARGCGCPHGQSGDCVLDTWDDADPRLCRPFTTQCHDRNLAALGYAKSRHDVLRHNLMSYHTPTSSNVRLTCGQLQRMNNAIDKYRKRVLVGEPVATLTSAAPSKSRYPGPKTVILQGRDLPTGIIQVRIGNQTSPPIASTSRTRIQPAFPQEISPGRHTISVLQGRQLEVFLTHGMDVTPLLRRPIDPDAFGNLWITAKSTAPQTQMVLGIGTPGPRLLLPGFLYSLQLRLTHAFGIVTDGKGEFRVPVRLRTVLAKTDVTMQALEVVGITRFTFTNPLRIVIP